MNITMEHGSGGKETSDLIINIFAKHFHNPILSKMEDCAVVEGSKRIAVTTDSFVVTPLFFAGGDIGKLAICGTINDISMSGAVPKYITCGFIIETGTSFETLETIAKSMIKAANEAGVQIVAGDTKVIEGNGGVYINTTGVGFVLHEMELSSSNCTSGDVVILSGNLGDHHATILSARMNIKNTIESDCAPLNEITKTLIDLGINIKTMRDVTRGGLATVLNEFSGASSCSIKIYEGLIPVSSQVGAFCKILGLDPLYMANEGKMVIVVDKQDSQRALEAMKNSIYGEKACIIGEVLPASHDNFDYKNGNDEEGAVILETSIGGSRLITKLYGEGLPRIC